MRKICSVDECNRFTHARGWCHMHLRRVVRHGSTDNRRGQNPKRVSVKAICSELDCDKQVEARGLCRTHYTRWLRYGSTQLQRRPRGVCSLEDCERPHNTHGLCRFHYIRQYTPPFKPCSEDGCNQQVRGHGFCGTHYVQKRNQGLLNAKQCPVEDCKRVVAAKGLCAMHRRRMLRFGQLDAPRYELRPSWVSTHDWFMSKVKREDGEGCWLWSGGVHLGYGRFYNADLRKVTPAHHFLAPPLASKGMVYHHLCENGLCVRPEHLEPMTRRDHQQLHHLVTQ